MSVDRHIFLHADYVRLLLIYFQKQVLASTAQRYMYNGLVMDGWLSIQYTIVKPSGLCYTCSLTYIGTVQFQD